MVRVKNRYITFKILYPPERVAEGDTDSLNKLELYKASPSSVSAKYIAQAVRQVVRENFGDFGHALVAASLSVRYFSNRTSTGIIKVSRDDESCSMVCFALMCMGNVEGLGLAKSMAVIFQVQRISGTIRKAQDALIRENKELINEIEAITG